MTKTPSLLDMIVFRFFKTQHETFHAKGQYINHSTDYLEGGIV